MTEDLNLPFPETATLAGRTITLRLMDDDDIDRVVTFARTLPQHDLLFLRRDITQRKQIEAWAQGIRRGSIVTILALEGDTVVGYATIDRGEVRWAQHAAELRVLVAENARGIGLGLRLTQEGFDTAVAIGVEKMMAHMTIDQQAAITVFENMGFRPEALLRDHVKDRDGVKHDLLILSQDVEQFLARRYATGLDHAIAELQAGG